MTVSVIKRVSSSPRPFQDMMNRTKVLSEIESMVSWCLNTMVGVMIKILHLKVEESPFILAQKKNLA